MNLCGIVVLISPIFEFENDEHEKKAGRTSPEGDLLGSVREKANQRRETARHHSRKCDRAGAVSVQSEGLTVALTKPGPAFEVCYAPDRRRNGTKRPPVPEADQFFPSLPKRPLLAGHGSDWAQDTSLQQRRLVTRSSRPTFQTMLDPQRPLAGE